MIRWGAQVSSDKLRRRARCTVCGHKGATIQRPSWAGEHIGFMPFPGGPDVTAICPSECRLVLSVRRVRGPRKKRSLIRATIPGGAFFQQRLSRWGLKSRRWRAYRSGVSLERLLAHDRIVDGRSIFRASNVCEEAYPRDQQALTSLIPLFDA